MLSAIVRYIKGYYLLVLHGGDVERLFNISKNHGAAFENIRQKNGKYYCRIPAKYYNDIVTYSKKAGVSVKVKRRVGLRYFFERYRKRKIFALCMLVFFAVLYYSTLFVWNIDVSCDGVYTDVQVKKYIEENHIPLGTRTKDVDCPALEKELRQAFPKIAWISCSLEGTCLTVTFTETVTPEEIRKSDEPCNIVAVKDAIVSQNIIHKGMVIARKGDEVKKGDVLITGVINVTNEYDELLETDYVSAEGEVYGIVEYNYMDEFDLSSYEKNYTGREDQSFCFIWFGNTGKIPNPFKKKYELFDTISESRQFKLFGYNYLPVGIASDKRREYTLERVTLDEKEAEKKAKKRLELYLDGLRKKGVVILENNVKIDIADGVLKAHGKIRCEELIGVPAEINIINQGETQ